MGGAGRCAGGGGETDGLVTPTLLPSWRQPGITRRFDGARRAARPAEPAQVAMPRPAGRARAGIQRDPRTHAVRLPQGLRLDFGGIAKGWAADRAAERSAGWPGAD